MWSASIVGGACIELCTVLKKDVGNFYHSQAIIMLLGRREPLYMLVGCYGYFNYIGCAFVWETTKTLIYLVQYQTEEKDDDDTDSDDDDKDKDNNQPRLIILQEEKQTYWNHIGGTLGESLIAGLIGSLGWGLLDTVGLKMLWWTWHNDEPLYEYRQNGVPVASSFWIFSSIASLNYILGKWYGRPSDIYIQKDHLTQETTTITKDTESETSTSVTTATEPIGARKFEKTNICSHLLIGCVLGPIATLLLMNIPFLILYHPLTTFLKYNASIPSALLKAIAWSGLLAAVYASVARADEVPERLEELLWIGEVENEKDSEFEFSDDEEENDSESEESDESEESEESGESDSEEELDSLLDGLMETTEEEGDTDEMDLFDDLTKEDDETEQLGDTKETAKHTETTLITTIASKTSNDQLSVLNDSGTTTNTDSAVVASASDEEYDYDQEARQRRQHTRLIRQARRPMWAIKSVVHIHYKWWLLIYILLTGIFSMYLLLVFRPEQAVRMSFGQPYTSLDSNCTQDIEYSFSGGFTRHKYVCERRYQKSRDIYRPCTKRDDPKLRKDTIRLNTKNGDFFDNDDDDYNSNDDDHDIGINININDGIATATDKVKEQEKGISFVDRLRRDYGVVMNHELIGQWFPLCGTVLDHQMTQTVGFDIIQLLVVCLLTAFCGMPRDIRSSFCGNICSELGALMLMLFFSLSMFFIPMSEDDGQDRIPIPGELGQKTVFHIISVMKWSMTLGLLGRIGK